MREIKFRAWEKSYKRMSKVTEIKWKEEHLYHQIFTQAIVNNKRIDDSYTYDFSGVSNGIVLMQYTGLKDKNGVEIYEGDIIRTHFNLDDVIQEPFIITWNEEKAMFEGVKTVKTIDDYFNTFSFFPEQRFIYEVIGNIHDNPELLRVRE